MEQHRQIVMQMLQRLTNQNPPLIFPAHHPWKHIFISTLVCCALGSGFFTVLEAENRPEKQWVPAGAPALEQKDYVDATW